MASLAESGRQNFSRQQIEEWSEIDPTLADELAVMNSAVRVGSYFLDTVPARLQTFRYMERVLGQEDPARRAAKIGLRVGRERALDAAGVDRTIVFGSRALIQSEMDNAQLTAVADAIREGHHDVRLIPDLEEAESLPGEWPDEIDTERRRNLIVVEQEDGGERVLLDDGRTLVEEGRTSQGLIRVAQHLSETALRGHDVLLYIGDFYA